MLVFVPPPSPPGGFVNVYTGKEWNKAIYNGLTSTLFPGFSPTRPTERERERDPGKRWSRDSRTKLFLREASFVSHVFVWLIREVHAVIATAR